MISILERTRDLFSGDNSCKKYETIRIRHVPRHVRQETGNIKLSRTILRKSNEWNSEPIRIIGLKLFESHFSHLTWNGGEGSNKYDLTFDLTLGLKTISTRCTAETKARILYLICLIIILGIPFCQNWLWNIE